MQTTGAGDRSYADLARDEGGCGECGGQREENDFDCAAARDILADSKSPDSDESRELDPEKPGLTQEEQGEEGSQNWDDDPPAGHAETLLEPKDG